MNDPASFIDLFSSLSRLQSGIEPPIIHENDGSFDLSLRYGRIGVKKAVLFLLGQQAIAFFPVEWYCPYRIGPGANE
jgi:hypothetical protein